MEICQQETPNLTVSVSKHEVVCESSVVGGRDKTKMERGLRCVYCAHVHAGATAVCIPEPSSPPFCLHLTAVRRLVNLQIHYTVPTPTPANVHYGCANGDDSAIRVHWKSNIFVFRKVRFSIFPIIDKSWICVYYCTVVPNT